MFSNRFALTELPFDMVASAIAACHVRNGVRPLRDLRLMRSLVDESALLDVADILLQCEEPRFFELTEGLATGRYLIDNSMRQAWFLSETQPQFPTPPEQIDFVISYSLKDLELAETLKAALVEKGFCVFVYPVNEHSQSDHWWLTFKIAMQAGAWFVPLLTENFFSGQGAALELDEAIATARQSVDKTDFFPILPCIWSLEPSDLRIARIADVPTLDLSGFSGSDKAGLFADWASAIGQRRLRQGLQRHAERLGGVRFSSDGNSVEFLVNCAKLEGVDVSPRFTSPDSLVRPLVETGDPIVLSRDGDRVETIAEFTHARAIAQDFDLVNSAAIMAEICHQEGIDAGDASNLADYLVKLGCHRDAGALYTYSFEKQCDRISIDHLDPERARRNEFDWTIMSHNWNEEIRKQVAGGAASTRHLAHTFQSPETIVGWWRHKYDSARSPVMYLVRDADIMGMVKAPLVADTSSDGYRTRFDLARQAAEAGDFGSAEDIMIEDANLSVGRTTKVPPLYMAARMAAEAREVERAIQILLCALDLEPTHGDVRKVLGRALSSLRNVATVVLRFIRERSFCRL